MNITEARRKAYRKGLKGMSKKSSISQPSSTLPLNQIVLGDSVKILNDAPEGWVDLVFADPPFNIGGNFVTGILTVAIGSVRRRIAPPRPATQIFVPPRYAIENNDVLVIDG